MKANGTEDPRVMHAAYRHFVAVLQDAGPVTALGALAMAAATAAHASGRGSAGGRTLLLDAYDSACAALEKREGDAS